MSGDGHNAGTPQFRQSDRSGGRLYDCLNCGTISKHRTVLFESAKMENVGVRRCSECYTRVTLQ